MAETISFYKRIVVFTFSLDTLGATQPKDLFYYLFESAPLDVMSKPIGTSIGIPGGFYLELKAVDERLDIKNPGLAITKYGLKPMPNPIRSALGYRI